MQLWAGCLLVVLISITYEILALSLAVLFYGIQSNAFYTKFVAILVVATALEIGSLFLIYKWSYSYPGPSDHCQPDRSGLHVPDANPSSGAGFLCRVDCCNIRAIFPRHARLPRGRRSPDVMVHRRWSVPHATDDADRRFVVSQPRCQPNARSPACQAG